MNHFSQQNLHLKKNWGNLYRARLEEAIASMPKFVPMPPLLSSLSSMEPATIDAAQFDEAREAINKANEAIDSIRSAMVLLEASPDYEFQLEESIASRQEAPAAPAQQELLRRALSVIEHADTSAENVQMAKLHHDLVKDLRKALTEQVF